MVQKIKHQLILDDSKESDLKLWDEVLRYKIDKRLSDNNEALKQLILKGIRFQRKEE